MYDYKKINQVIIKPRVINKVVCTVTCNLKTKKKINKIAIIKTIKEYFKFSLLNQKKVIKKITKSQKIRVHWINNEFFFYQKNVAKNFFYK